MWAKYVSSCKKSESVVGETGIGSWEASSLWPPHRHTCSFVGWDIAFTQFLAVKWSRHMKFQHKYFFNLLSLSAPKLFIWRLTEMLRAVTFWTSGPLQVPGSPIFKNLTKLNKKIPSPEEVNSCPHPLRSISGQIYIHSPSFDTRGF